MTDLRTALNATHNRVVNLGPGTYTLDGSATLHGRVVHGPATIQLAPRTERDMPGLILAGTGAAIDGLTIVGPMPDGHGYDPDWEGQHAIRVDGAVGATVTNTAIRNVFGDGIYIGTVGQLAHGDWTSALAIAAVAFDEIGRHAITANALSGGHISALNIGRTNLAPFDVEPPGHPWGCLDLVWSDSDVNDHGGGFVFANKGVGGPGKVGRITLDGIRCHNRPFTMTVNPTEGRRAGYTVRHCYGAGVVNVPPLVFRNVDGVTVEDVRQACAGGVDLVAQHGCTGVTVK